MVERPGPVAHLAIVTLPTRRLTTRSLREGISLVLSLTVNFVGVNESPMVVSALCICVFWFYAESLVGFFQGDLGLAVTLGQGFLVGAEVGGVFAS